MVFHYFRMSTALFKKGSPRCPLVGISQPLQTFVFPYDNDDVSTMRRYFWNIP